MTIRITKKQLKGNLLKKTAARRAALDAQMGVESAASNGYRRNDLSPPLKLTVRPTSSFTEATRRSRKTTPEQLERVINCIRRFGVVVPVLVRPGGEIVDGHIVVEAARRLGLEELPCIGIDHLEEGEIRALRLALNRISESGEWDLDDLKLELQELTALEIDVLDIGFSAQELDIIMLDDPGQEEDDPFQPDVQSHTAISRPGDLWLLGTHRIVCADSLDPRTYSRLLGDERAEAIFADPPFNVPIAGFVSGLGKTKHQDFAMGIGELSQEQFCQFLRTYMEHSSRFLLKGGVLFSCIDWRGIDTMIAAGRDVGLNLLNLVVWSKGSGGMGGFYRSAHELIAVFGSASSPTINNIELGRHGRDRTNLWTYPGANRPGSSAASALKDHPTPKPVELVADALLDVTKRGGIVFDPFLGSGTTIIAAEKTGRVGRGIELDPKYVDVALRRWEALTGECAIHEETGCSSAELLRQRQSEDAAEDQPDGCEKRGESGQ